METLFAELFTGAHPVEIDIGCGKGKFLLARAAENPEINFLGIDRVSKWMEIGRARGEKRSLANLKFLKVEAREFIGGLPSESVSAFHLYFPDPWPKRRQRKRRLVTAEFLKLLHRPLVPGGLVEIATDDSDYFEQIKKTAAAAGELWSRIQESTGQRLIHPALKTNYELKYEAAGKRNFYLELQKRSAPHPNPLPVGDEKWGRFYFSHSRSRKI